MTFKHLHFLLSHATICSAKRNHNQALLNHYRAQNQSSLSADDRNKLDELDKNMIKRKAQLYEIEQSLPQMNSMYLKVITKQYLKLRS
jgi:hypothetical protein